MSDLIDYVALSLLPAWRCHRIADSLRSGCTPADVLVEHCAEATRRKGKLPVWASPEDVRREAEVAVRGAERLGIDVLPLTDARYPPLLKAIADPPPVLWVAGRVPAVSQRAVAIVGSRSATSYALNVADTLAADLSAHGISVVSGLARGVDSAAHRGALTGKGATVGVLGCGVDVAYPPEHVELIAAVRASGAVISEVAPGTQPRPIFFPRRNRIISGLVQAVVIVEAGEKSGSLITARMALEQGRDVLAVPGNVLTGRNKGGHALLRDGARMVETAQDVLDELPRTENGNARQNCADLSDALMRALSDGEAHLADELCSLANLEISSLLPRLLELELQGLVRREPGGRFVLRRKNVLG
ncbi:MAG: DNA-processing protein DprA [Vicinamibacterales bacterium]